MTEHQIIERQTGGAVIGSKSTDGASSDQEYSFDLGDEGFYDANLEVLGSNRGNATIVRGSVPYQGQTGMVSIKVHWWCDGLTWEEIKTLKPSKSFVKYKLVVRSSKGDFKSRSLILVIGSDWYNHDVPDLFPSTVGITELVHLLGHVFTPEQNGYRIRYNNLGDGDQFIVAETTELKNKLLALLSKGNVVDLCFACKGSDKTPGNQSEIRMASGDSLKVADVNTWVNENWLTNLQPHVDANEIPQPAFGLVYMMNGKNNGFIQQWLNLGFNTVVGTRGVDYMPEFMLTDFWQSYLGNGDTAQECADYAWNKAKQDWKLIPGYAPIVSTTTQTDWWWCLLPDPPCAPPPRRTTVTSERDSYRVHESQLLVYGNPNRRVTD